MIEVSQYLDAAFLASPLLFFIVAVSFRLLDNSGYLLLKQEIIIESSYVSLKILKEQLQNTPDETFRRKLKQVMVYRKLHRFFLVMMILSIPIPFWYLFSIG